MHEVSVLIKSGEIYLSKISGEVRNWRTLAREKGDAGAYEEKGSQMETKMEEMAGATQAKYLKVIYSDNMSFQSDSCISVRS